MNPSERVPEIRAKMKIDDEPYKKPSKVHRMAMRPTKSPYDFKKAKKRRKMAKASKKKNMK